ncbi:MAG: glutaredoxin domain-containing protein [bacterium]
MKLQGFVIYSTPTCHYCHQLKDWLTENRIAFQEKDVVSDIVARQEMVTKSQQMGVPVSVLQFTDGKQVKEEVVTGFDQMRLSRLLSIRT